MKKPLAILALLAIIAGLFFLLRTKNPPVPQSVVQNGNTPAIESNRPIVQNRTQIVPSTLADTSAQVNGPQTNLASHAASPNPTAESGTATNEPPALPPWTVLDKTRVIIHNYHATFGENPVGTNPEIAAALHGKNPKQINFLEDSGLRLNGKGEIIDGYGTPFFFHQISAHEMEIHSAGPDKVMWTPDDLVTK
jgi:hypothetical protein